MTLRGLQGAELNALYADAGFDRVVPEIEGDVVQSLPYVFVFVAPKLSTPEPTEVAGKPPFRGVSGMPPTPSDAAKPRFVAFGCV